jgi:hypothetical protein
MPAPLAFSELSTYVRSLAAVRSGPEGGTHAPLLASGELPAGHCRHLWKALPLSCMLLMTLSAAAAAHLQEPEERLAGVHAALSEKPPAKLVSLPVVGSQSTQLSPSAAGMYPAACRHRVKHETGNLAVQSCLVCNMKQPKHWVMDLATRQGMSVVPVPVQYTIAQHQLPSPGCKIWHDVTSSPDHRYGTLTRKCQRTRCLPCTGKLQGC